MVISHLPLSILPASLTCLGLLGTTLVVDDLSPPCGPCAGSPAAPALPRIRALRLMTFKSESQALQGLWAVGHGVEGAAEAGGTGSRARLTFGGGLPA